MQWQEQKRWLKNEMKTTSVELFAGIGGFRVACEELGIQTIWANDINDDAAIVYQDNFKQGTFVKGDIWKLINDVPDHDLLTAGFPCQPFSSAGKKNGLSDPRGTLFQAIIEIIKKCEPKYFVLENVKRLLSMDQGRTFATIIDKLSTLGYLIEWRILNAKNFCLAQNRERIIIIGTKYDSYIKTYLINQKDIDIRLLGNKFDFKTIENWQDIKNHKKVFPKWGLCANNKFIGHDIIKFFESGSEIVLKDIIQKDVDQIFDYTKDTNERIKFSTKVDRFYDGVELIYNQNGGARMGYSIFGINGLASTLTGSTSRHYERYLINNKYRRLTNIEYARLQGFPDNHCQKVSIHKQYVLYGNAVPPQMVSWAIKKLINDSFINLSQYSYQMRLI